MVADSGSDLGESVSGQGARTLSRFVLKLPTGVGLRSPWTMQMARQEAGLPRILLASAVSAGGKAVGQRGWFYRVAGHDVNAIDGPGGKVVYPGNASAKLPPKDPDRASRQIRRALVAALPVEVGNSLGGVVIIDANNPGRNVLGRDSDREDELFPAVRPAVLRQSGRPRPTTDPDPALSQLSHPWETSTPTRAQTSKTKLGPPVDKWVRNEVVTNISDQATSALDAARSGSGAINRLHRIGVRSEYAYIAGFASIGLSYLSYFLSRGKKGDDKAQSDRWGIFIGHWAPTFFALGIALKLEEAGDR